MQIDDFSIRLCSPDYQTDWGVVGDLISATLTRTRIAADLLEFSVHGDSPVREMLSRPMCGVEVRLRGKVEFLGHVFQRRGKIDKNSPVTVYARDETEVLDQTLAVPVPTPVSASFGEKGWYSNGWIEPESLNDTAQAFPRDHESAGHYAWALPFAGMGWSPTTIGEFLAPMLNANLRRVGYSRATIVSGSSPVDSLLETSEGAPYLIVKNPSWADTGVPLSPPPWAAGFDGILVRMQYLREVVAPFMAWADANTDRSFNLVACGGIGEPVTLGLRQCPEEFPVVLSESAGSVVGGDWSIADHTGSRVILGGPGESHARMYMERQDADREESGRVIERFKDAGAAKLRYAGKDQAWEVDGAYAGYPRRYLRETRPTVAEKNAVRAYFAQAGAKELAATAPQTTLSAVLQENERIRYGGTTGYQLGQRVRIDVGTEVPQSGRIEKVTISLTPDSGLRVTPEIGDGLLDSNGQIARAVRGLADNRRLEASDR